MPSINGRLGAISLESVSHPGFFIRHYCAKCYNHKAEDSHLYRDDASWYPVKGLTGEGVSFESTNYEGEYLQHQDSRCVKQKQDGTEKFKQEASWKVTAPLKKKP